LRFIISTDIDVKVLRKYVTTEFIARMLLLFDSEDPRERDYLKTILHRVYGKFMPLRAFIRKAVNNVFFRFVFERFVVAP
jgi:serine/threonine-protein phosphatase 2A regulatory subunit B'